MHVTGADVVLVRHGEIGVKSAQVQRSMERRLATNLQTLCTDREIDAQVEREHGRLYVHVDPDDLEAATAVSTDTFGVVSASPALVVDPGLDAIREGLSRAAREHYTGGTFAVRARRAGEPEAHPFSSADVEKAGGDSVWRTAEALDLDPAVDLDNPDQTFHVEVREDRGFVFLEKRPGPGGLPLGSQAPLVAMISGGIDSPVAAWEAMKRGSPIHPVYIDLGEYGGPDHIARAEATMSALSRFVPGANLSLRVVPGGEAIDRLVSEMDALRMLGLRRFMLAAGAAVADHEEAAGIVTGEAIGQKSSQTAANLRVTSAVTDYPIHRPLLTRDKAEITAQARKIGTFEDATIPTGCDRIAPSLPATAAGLDEVRGAEPDDLDELVERAVAPSGRA